MSDKETNQMAEWLKRSEHVALAVVSVLAIWLCCEFAHWLAAL